MEGQYEENYLLLKMNYRLLSWKKDYLELSDFEVTIETDGIEGRSKRQ